MMSSTFFIFLSLLIPFVFTCNYNGFKRTNGETWVSNTNFYMRCTISERSWNADIIGCITDEGRHISVGETANENGLLVECIRLPSGTVEFRRRRDPIQNCEGHQIGETWIANGNFRKTCSSEGQQVVLECLTDAGFPIAVGSSSTINGIKHNCNKQSDGSVLLERDLTLTSTEIDNRIDNNPQVLIPPAPLPDLPRPSFLPGPPGILPPGYLRDLQRFESDQLHPVELTTLPPVTVSPPLGARQCYHEGQWRKPEETWISEDKFTKKCTSTGAVVILNCVINKNENVTINIDSKVKIGRKVYTCTRKDGSIFYNEKMM